jgi:hypothetical protein
MVDWSLVDENDAARLELSEFIARLDERSFRFPVGSDWTISPCLCHLAFWDHRVLFVVKRMGKDWAA